MIATVGFNFPTLCLLIEDGRFHPRFKLHVVAQIIALSHVFGIVQNFILSRITFRPLPFLLQGFIERIGVFQTLNINTRARIAVPVPSTADIRAGFKAFHAPIVFVGAVNGIHARKTGTNNDNIQMFD